MLLEVQDLTVSYNASLPAVDRVCLQLAAGESLGLVGESGCGKSTIGRSLIQLLPEGTQTSGKISINGEELGEESLDHPSINWRGERIALIFQDPMTRLNPLMTVEAHGIEMLRSHLPKISYQDAQQRLSDTLRSVRIDPSRANQYPHEFSGGMRQRVMIALSLLLDPVLLVADEPTTSLDITVATEILQELTVLRHNRSMGLLLITHDLGLVSQYCDRIAVMYDGSIVETGTVDQIFRNPKHPYTQSLLRSVIHFKVDNEQEPESSKPESQKTESQKLESSEVEPQQDSQAVPPPETHEVVHEPTSEVAREEQNEPNETGSELIGEAQNEIPKESGSLTIYKSNNALMGEVISLSAPTRKSLLKVRQLTKHYVTGGNFVARLFDRSVGLVKAVDGIDLDIFPGDIFGIIGESGSGKSTTGRAILQLIRPDSGSVLMNGVELTKCKGEELRQMRSQMQMIFQDPRACLNPHMSIFRSVADPLLIHKQVKDLEAAKPRVLKILEKVGLNSQFGDRYPQDLSGGQLQRVAIARALITNPKFLICDEPVSMLDASIQAQVLQLMLDLKKEFNLTYLFITHDLAVAQYFCTHIAVMRRGKIVEQGTTSEVLGHPQHEYTKALLSSIPRIPVLN
ncbi:ABC transporter ATP-binding protein [Tumidithrix elongata RA019]|uniref:ABC transporter ATP-binding protein n=1 Tax=Tumidithrix elongata BACA0141 TaxID=2716417 RepID=A0AAW9Q667_9CYAN|nr:ABC transporter ATP-binding protein [Tumidithrix elongata RA019]